MADGNNDWTNIFSASKPGTMLSQNYDPQQTADQLELAKLIMPYGGKEREIARQQAYADELRKTAAPQMRGTGRIQTAAHPLEFLGAGAQRAVGGMQDRELEERRDKNQTGLVAKIQELMDRRKGGGASPLASGVSPFDEGAGDGGVPGGYYG